MDPLPPTINKPRQQSLDDLNSKTEEELFDIISAYNTTILHANMYIAVARREMQKLFDIIRQRAEVRKNYRQLAERAIEMFERRVQDEGTMRDNLERQLQEDRVRFSMVTTFHVAKFPVRNF